MVTTAAARAISTLASEEGLAAVEVPLPALVFGAVSEYFEGSPEPDERTICGCGVSPDHRIAPNGWGALWAKT
jgi:hypothetical protein